MEKKEEIPLLSGSATYNIIIPDHVEIKILHLCTRINSVEWSGILFYNAKGSFKDNDLSITCCDILLMDIGSGGATDFDMTPEVAKYMVDNPELMDCQMGLIHSHNNMTAFFSGVDLKTLQIKGKDTNNYVSLIVNNEGSYVAAVTRKLKRKRIIKQIAVYDLFDTDEQKEEKEFEEEDCIIEYFPLKILRSSIYQELNSKINKLKIGNEKSSFQMGYSNYNTNYKAKDSYLPFNQKDTLPYNKTNEYEYNDNKFTPKKESKVEDSTEGDKVNDSDGAYSDIQYEDIAVETKTLDSLLYQLITGSILISDTSKLDLDKWSNMMLNLYKKRFGDTPEGFKAFNSWADSYIEFLLYGISDNDLIELQFNEEEVVAIYAYNLIKKLEKLPTNVYIERFIYYLNNYIL